MSLCGPRIRDPVPRWRGHAERLSGSACAVWSAVYACWAARRGQRLLLETLRLSAKRASSCKVPGYHSVLSLPEGRFGFLFRGPGPSGQFQGWPLFPLGHGAPTRPHRTGDSAGPGHSWRAVVCALRANFTPRWGVPGCFGAPGAQVVPSPAPMHTAGSWPASSQPMPSFFSVSTVRNTREEWGTTQDAG